MGAQLTDSLANSSCAGAALNLLKVLEAEAATCRSLLMQVGTILASSIDAVVQGPLLEDTQDAENVDA